MPSGAALARPLSRAVPREPVTLFVLPVCRGSGSYPIVAGLPAASSLLRVVSFGEACQVAPLRRLRHVEPRLLVPIVFHHHKLHAWSLSAAPPRSRLPFPPSKTRPKMDRGPRATRDPYLCYVLCVLVSARETPANAGNQTELGLGCAGLGCVADCLHHTLGLKGAVSM